MEKDKIVTKGFRRNFREKNRAFFKDLLDFRKPGKFISIFSGTQFTLYSSQFSREKTLIDDLGSLLPFVSDCLRKWAFFLCWWHQLWYLPSSSKILRKNSYEVLMLIFFKSSLFDVARFLQIMEIRFFRSWRNFAHLSRGRS